MPEAAIGDVIEAWHRSGQNEGRELWQFLGMTEDEYSIWVMDARTLPLLRTTRETRENLVAATARYLGGLRAANNPADRAAIHALWHWIGRRG